MYAYLSNKEYANIWVSRYPNPYYWPIHFFPFNVQNAVTDDPRGHIQDSLLLNAIEYSVLGLSTAADLEANVFIQHKRKYLKVQSVILCEF